MRKAAVLFPGIGYHCDKPLLYYAKKLAGQYGYEKCIDLSYSYDESGNIRGNEEKMQIAFYDLYRKAEEKLSHVDFRSFDEVLFISKSIGTIIASAYAQKHNVVCRHVFYTPLKQTFFFHPKDATAFIGSADPWIEVTEIKTSCQENGVYLNIYQNANHSLETGNVFTDLNNLNSIIKKTEVFLNMGEGGNRK